MAQGEGPERLVRARRSSGLSEEQLSSAVWREDRRLGQGLGCQGRVILSEARASSPGWNILGSEQMIGFKSTLRTLGDSERRSWLEGERGRASSPCQNILGIEEAVQCCPAEGQAIRTRSQWLREREAG